MRISELPEEIRLIALQRQKECNDTRFSKNTDYLTDAFPWDVTPEGESYWSYIHRRTTLIQTDDQIIM